MVGLHSKTDAIGSIYREEGVRGTLNRCKNYVLPLPAAYFTRVVHTVSPTDDRVYRIRVDPQRVKYLSTMNSHFPVTGPDAVVGSVGGPWDRYKKPYQETEEYVSIRQHLVEGTPWRRTPKGQRRVRQNRSEEWIREEEERINRLAETILEEGYRSQEELVECGYEERIKRKQRVRSMEIADEIFVGLGRNDDLIRLAGGRHRLAIAQILDIDSIPAMLTLRHEVADVQRAALKPMYVTSARGDEADWRPVSG